LIYLKESREQIFDEFESVAIPIIKKYNGRLLLRIRPGPDSVIESQIEKPYEIHVAEFDTEEDFRQFLQDDERKKFLHLKDQSIRSSVLIKGSRM
jgi:uncharacterized protein (DUF1330 family)